MEQEIKSIIESHLPAQVGETLRKILEQGERDKAELVTLKNEVSDLRKKNSELQGEVLKMRETATQYNQIVSKTEELKELERNRKVFEAELKLTESEKRVAEMAGFVGMVFKSPIFRKTTNESLYTQEIWDNGVCKRVPTGSSRTEENHQD